MEPSRRPTTTAPGDAGRPDPSWARLYTVGGYAAIVYVLLVAIPVVLIFTAPLPPTEGRELLEYIADGEPATDLGAAEAAWAAGRPIH